MIGESRQPFECDCGVTISRKKDFSQHSRTRNHIVTTCVHHWQIKPASGPQSSGSCNKCGSIRDFSNSIDSYGNWADSIERKNRQIKDELEKTFQ